MHYQNVYAYAHANDSTGHIPNSAVMNPVWTTMFAKFQYTTLNLNQSVRPERELYI